MERDFTFRGTWSRALSALPSPVRVEVLTAILQYADTGEVGKLSDMAAVAFSFIKADIEVEVEAQARAEEQARLAEMETLRKKSEAGKRGMAKRWGETAGSDHAVTPITPITEITSVKSVIDVMPVGGDVEVEKERTKERETNTDDVEVECNPGKKQPSSPEKEKEKAVCKHTERESEKEPPKSRKVFRPPTVEEVYGFAVETGASHADPEDFHNFYTSNGWKVGRNPMKDWRAAFRRWEREHRNRDEEKERISNEKIIRTGNGNRGQQKSGPIWSPTDDQRAHPEKYYQTTF